MPYLIIHYCIHYFYLSVLAMNRDESFFRETASLQFWPDTEIFCGKDLIKGGSWLAINKKGTVFKFNGVPIMNLFRLACFYHKYKI